VTRSWWQKVAAEPYRDIDFSRAKRGPVVPPEPGKTKISVRLDNRVIDHFRSIVEKSGGGNYQTLINDALVAYIEQQSVLEAVRHVVREEMLGAKSKRGLTGGSTRTRAKAMRAG
jgi:uncharacterized protein (DUF4415 family)